MANSDRDTFDTLFIGVHHLYRQEADSLGLDLLFAVLSDYGIEEIGAAVKQYCQDPEVKFCPTPNEIIARIKRNREKAKAVIHYYPPEPPPALKGEGGKARPVMREMSDVTAWIRDNFKLDRPGLLHSERPEYREPTPEEIEAADRRKRAAKAQFRVQG